MTLRVTAEAARHIETIDTWWRTHREASPDLFADELAQTLDLIERMPTVGRRWPASTVPGVRRVILRASRHHVYYLERHDAVFVLAVWGAVRRAGPPL